jgi:hypothetical protein
LADSTDRVETFMALAASALLRKFAEFFLDGWPSLRLAIRAAIIARGLF